MEKVILLIGPQMLRNPLSDAVVMTENVTSVINVGFITSVVSFTDTDHLQSLFQIYIIYIYFHIQVSFQSMLPNKVVKQKSEARGSFN